jgi:hypothetical protein
VETIVWRLCTILYDPPQKDWSPQTLDEIADLLRRYDLAPREREE